MLYVALHRSLATRLSAMSDHGSNAIEGAVTLTYENGQEFVRVTLECEETSFTWNRAYHPKGNGSQSAFSHESLIEDRAVEIAALIGLIRSSPLRILPHDVGARLRELRRGLSADNVRVHIKTIRIRGDLSEALGSLSMDKSLLRFCEAERMVIDADPDSSVDLSLDAILECRTLTSLSVPYNVSPNTAVRVAILMRRRNAALKELAVQVRPSDPPFDLSEAKELKECNVTLWCGVIGARVKFVGDAEDYFGSPSSVHLEARDQPPEGLVSGEPPSYEPPTDRQEWLDAFLLKNGTAIRSMNILFPVSTGAIWESCKLLRALTVVGSRKMPVPQEPVSQFLKLVNVRNWEGSYGTAPYEIRHFASRFPSTVTFMIDVTPNPPLDLDWFSLNREHEKVRVTRNGAMERMNGTLAIDSELPFAMAMTPVRDRVVSNAHREAYRRVPRTFPPVFNFCRLGPTSGPGTENRMAGATALTSSSSLCWSESSRRSTLIGCVVGPCCLSHAHTGHSRRRGEEQSLAGNRREIQSGVRSGESHVVPPALTPQQLPADLVAAIADLALLVARMEGTCSFIFPSLGDAFVPGNHKAINSGGGAPFQVIFTAFPGIRWNGRTMMKALVWADK